MANLGLERRWPGLGIGMLRTAGGDKYVLEEMLRLDAAIGGEQSGHMIFRAFATTGHGMLTALQTLEAGAGKRNAGPTTGGGPHRLPSITRKRAEGEESPRSDAPVSRTRFAPCEAALEGTGRVLVRFSGTEPLVRVMVEAEQLTAVEDWRTALPACFVKNSRRFSHKRVKYCLFGAFRRMTAIQKMNWTGQPRRP